MCVLVFVRLYVGYVGTFCPRLGRLCVGSSLVAVEEGEGSSCRKGQSICLGHGAIVDSMDRGARFPLTESEGIIRLLFQKHEEQQSPSRRWRTSGVAGNENSDGEDRARFLPVTAKPFKGVEDKQAWPGMKILTERTRARSESRRVAV